jgi:23S rRNA (cytidine1920-2'-O)/16S rRNA (cytidine1409-2'-O)-methyltransferase
VVRRRLDAELVRRGLVPSRTRAAQAVAAGRVVVDGAPAFTPARQVAPDEAISVTGPPPRFVSRAGSKLEGALDAFALEVEGRRVLDAGASTGGFTDCLLQRDAEHVYSVDVGHGQLAWTLRADARVTVLDRTNVRELTPGHIDGVVPLAVADLSFISLLTVAPALGRCTTADGDLVLLVKPQFEAGRPRIGKGGVVRDPRVHAEVLHEVVDGLGELGLVAVAATASRLRGADGNREFFVHCRRSGDRVSSEHLLALANDV